MKIQVKGLLKKVVVGLVSALIGFSFVACIILLILFSGNVKQTNNIYVISESNAPKMTCKIEHYQVNQKKIKVFSYTIRDITSIKYMYNDTHYQLKEVAEIALGLRLEYARDMRMK